VDQYRIGKLPPNGYRVSALPDQRCNIHVTDKTERGFTVVLTPTSDSETLDAGIVDVIAIG
jgi:hypothetical protein